MTRDQYIMVLEQENEALRIENGNLKRRLHNLRKQQDHQLQRVNARNKGKTWKDNLLYWATTFCSLALGGIAWWKIIGRIAVR